MELSKADVNNIRSAYYKLQQLDASITKAEACGIDCQDLKRRREAAQKTLKDYNTVYGESHGENLS